MVMRWLAILIGSQVLVACGEGTSLHTLAVDPYLVQVSHKPDPLKVGFTAEMQMRLLDSGQQVVDGCEVKMRQYMPDMEMKKDNDFIDLSHQNGVYVGQTREFSMGGVWKIDTHIHCGEEAVGSLVYQLEWPE